MARTEDYSRCNELLEECHTACDPQATTCPANNTQSFQLSIEEVRASVNAPEKLVFPNITRFDGLEALVLTILNPFTQDGFNEEIMAWYERQVYERSALVAPDSTLFGLSTTCDPVWLVRDAQELYPTSNDLTVRDRQAVIDQCRNIMTAELNRIEIGWNGNIENGVTCLTVSYEAVSEFGIELSRLYEGRNRDTHPDRNPMERTPGVAVHDVDPKTFEALSRMRFPVAYNFEQTDHGVKHLPENSVRYEIAPDLQDFPGESSSYTRAWQTNIDHGTLGCGRYESIGSDRCQNPLNGDEFARQASVTEIHPIKCCAGSSNGNQNSESDWGRVDNHCDNNRLKMDTASGDRCPERFINDQRGDTLFCVCPKGTFEDAIEFCASQGGRVCTEWELESNCATSAGCGFDNRLVWTMPTYSHNYAIDGCMSSQSNLDLVRRAMSAADESLSLLVGKQTSIGTIRRYAALVNDESIPNASDQLPGTYCLDDPLDSNFLGYYVSEKFQFLLLLLFQYNSLSSICTVRP